MLKTFVKDQPQPKCEGNISSKEEGSDSSSKAASTCSVGESSSCSIGESPAVPLGLGLGSLERKVRVFFFLNKKCEILLSCLSII